MAINLSQISGTTTRLSALAGLVAVTPQAIVGYAPQNPASASGDVSVNQSAPTILFHYEGENSIGLDSDITDHYVEDNTAVQDQIALRPAIVTVHGYIGELNDVAPYGLQTLKTAADKLTAVTAYSPSLTINAQIAYNQALLAYQTVQNTADAAVSAMSSISNAVSGSNGQATIDTEGDLVPGTSQNQQQKIFQQFYGYWVNRTLFTIQTPWCVFQNMAIKSLRVIQGEETSVISDFEVTFKQIRNAFSAFNSIQPAKAGRSATQSSSKVSKGATSGKPTTTTPATATASTLVPQ